jgi:predicted component of type VI protein secretion system
MEIDVVRAGKKGTAVSTGTTALPEGAKVKLSVVKGLRTGKNYALKEGVTYVGRKGQHAVDVDLTEQENPGGTVAVNRFALIWYDRNGLGIADTGRRVTRVNGERVLPGKRLPLKDDDTLQFGKTVLKVKVILKKRTAAQK